jgi:hypothetical protein
MTETDYRTQYALLRTFRACFENGASLVSLADTVDDFIVAFDLTPEQTESLLQVKRNLKDGKKWEDIFRDCAALDKRVRFFLTLPYAYLAGRLTSSLDLAIDYLDRFAC